MLKVVIVGAGPAGLFAAYKLAEKNNVTILEKHRFVGGSGLHSDGKLNFHPLIGGDLTRFIPEDEAWELVYDIRNLFKKLGVIMMPQDEAGLEELEAEASKAGLKFIRIEQTHIGSDRLPKIMVEMKNLLEGMGVEFCLNTEAFDLILDGGRVKAVETNNGEIAADAVILAPGRIGSQWLIDLMERLDVEMKYNPIDLGVRVEVPNAVMDQVIHGYGSWDPKFHLYTPSYDDFVRTFCVCPAGFVVKEHYGDNLFGVNGHSIHRNVGDNTNFALLVRVSLTEPIENTTEYGHRIAQLANTLGGKKPLLQRLGDLREHRRSTWKRIQRSYVTPTFQEVTPGDIAMAYPQRIVTNILEGLEMLDKVMPGINADSTLIYAPEIKFYAMRIKTDRYLRTKIPNLYVAGDGAGVSRGIIGAAATGIVAVRGINEQSNE